MALPDVDICKRIDIDVLLLSGLKVTLPGGAEIQAMMKGFPDPQELVGELLGQANAALAPLVPIFNIIDAARAIFECIKAIPGVLGPPPDPSKLSDCISNLSKAIDKLLSLIPQVSVGRFIKDLLAVLIVFLIELRAQISAIISVNVRITASRARATLLGATVLEDNLDCAQANVDLQFTALQNSAQPLNRLLGLMNLFLQLIGQEPIGEISFGTDPNAALAPLDLTIEALTFIHEAIPIVTV